MVYISSLQAFQQESFFTIQFIFEKEGKYRLQSHQPNRIILYSRLHKAILYGFLYHCFKLIKRISLEVHFYFKFFKIILDYSWIYIHNRLKGSQAKQQLLGFF